MSPDYRFACRQGFTLIEILLVVVQLGILAALVVPMFPDMQTDAKTIAASRLQGWVQTRIYQDYVNTQHFPDTVKEDWFPNQSMPRNPFFPDAPFAVVSESSPDVHHPASKTAGGFWYNTANGKFRVCVESQDDPAETLKIYNIVNSSQVASLAQTTP